MLQICLFYRQDKKNATSGIFEPFDERKEASGKPTSFLNPNGLINKIKKSNYNYHPQTKQELKNLMEELIEERGNEGDFNDIDTSVQIQALGTITLTATV